MRTGMLMMLVGCAPTLYSQDYDPNATPVPTDWMWERPDNRWPIIDPPAGTAGEGFAVGQQIPDLRVADQFGEMVSIWQFHDRVVLLDISTMWCGPCRELAEGTQETIDEFDGEPFSYVTVLQQNVESNPPSGEDLNLWADNFGISGPVVEDGDAQTADAVVAGQYPVLLVIDPGLRIAERVNPQTDAAARAAIERVLHPE